MAEINALDNQDLEGSTDMGGIDLGEVDGQSGGTIEPRSSEDYEDLGAEVIQDFEFDNQANMTRFDKLKKIMRLVAQTQEDYGEIQGSPSPYILPLLTITAINFNSVAYPAILNDGQPVKCGYYGNDNGRPVTKLTPNPNPFNGQAAIIPQQVIEGAGDKGRAATQYSQFASWQLLHDIMHWEEELDKLTTMLPNVGCLFKKVYPDRIRDNVQSDLILPFQLVVHPTVKSLETAPRISQVVEYYRHECESFIKSGEWLPDVDISHFSPIPFEKFGDTNQATVDNSPDRDAALIFIEQHRRYDLDGDGYPEPVIVLVEKDTGIVCKVESNYLKSAAKRNSAGEIIYAEPIQYFVKFGFFRDPAGSIYDIGFGEIFYEQTDAVNSAVNMLIDSAHRANLHTGLIGKGGVRMQGGTLTLKQGSYMFVESYGANLKDNIVQLEAKEPSQVLFSLLGFMTDYISKSTSQSDVMAGEMASNTTAGGTLGMIESGMKQYKAIMKRIKNSIDKEVGIIKKFNTVAFKKPNPFNVNFDDPIWSDEIFYINASMDINNLTSSIRLAKTQILIDTYNTGIGQSFNRDRIAKEVLDSMVINNPEEFLQPNPPTTAEQQLQLGEQQNKQLELQVLMQKEKNRETELNIKAFEAKGRGLLDHAKAIKTFDEINPNKDDKFEAEIRLDNAKTLKTIAEAHAIVNDVGDAREETTITE